MTGPQSDSVFGKLLLPNDADENLFLHFVWNHCLSEVCPRVNVCHFLCLLPSDGTAITVNMQHGIKCIRMELYRVREPTLYELAEL